MRLTHGTAVLAITAGSLLNTDVLVAQSVLLGTISGFVVSEPDGAPLAGTLITLASLDAAVALETTTDASGRFTFQLLAPGSYEVRAEALGFRPLLARTLSMSGGSARTLSLTLTPASPPMITVDTLALAAASATRWTAGGVRLGSDDLSELPYRFEDLAGVAALATSLDGALGSRGLPGSMTHVVADGVPFYRAPHPLLLAEHLPDVLFPRSALSSLTVFHDAPDVEWAGSAGGYAVVATRTATRGRGLELEGAWSGDPLWSSSELDFPTPSLLSFQGGARTSVAISPDGASLVVAADALRQETPLAPRVSADLAAELTGLDPDLLAALASPSTERVTRYSGLARFDVQPGATSRAFVRGAAGYAKRDFDGPGPVGLDYGSGPPHESIEFSMAGGFVSQASSRMSLELRAGVSGSNRTFDASMADVAGAFVAESASRVGTLAGGPAESSRTDLVLLPQLMYEVGPGSIKVGLLARATRHSMAHGSAAPGDFFFSDASSLLAGQGFAAMATTPEATFTTREFGGFAQYDLRPAPGLRVSLGGRIDWEVVPGTEAALNEAWLQASGLRNDDHPSSFPQLGGRAALTWDPDAAGRTTAFATLTLHSGDVDPRVLYQLYSQDTGATSTRFAGSGLVWPAGTFPGGAEALPTLTLLGPDARPPRSASASGGLVRQLGRGLAFHIGGSIRRTDFLMRRRNLNLPAEPLASDAYGRDVYGTLAQDGALVTATGADARRFPSFADVWALDPDGWSEYKGVTLGLERQGEGLDLYASYTRSVTEDNWVGAARGVPGAALSPLLPADDEWTTARSDFDMPHRASAGAVVRLGALSVSAAYGFRSGLPFTPRYRAGVDANGDGSIQNDVAIVPDGSQLGELASEWPCLAEQVGGFARRNSCRGPQAHSVNVRLRVGLGRLGGRDASLVLDGLDLVEGSGGVLDDALLLVDPAGTVTTSPDGRTVTVPVIVNSGFGRVLYPTSRGRMLRVGLRIG